MTTYYARVDYSYSGDSKFTIPFSYIKKEHIVVFVNDVKTTNYTYITSSQIEVKDELKAEDVVSIRRTTPIKDKLVDFTDLNILNGETQNLAQEQVFNAVQEMYDKNEQQTQNFQKDINDYKEEIEDKIQEVKDATDVINTFKESVETCVKKAKEASNSADVATAKAEEASQTLSTKEDKANKGIANGYAGLDAEGKVPKAQLPSTGWTPSLLQPFWSEYKLNRLDMLRADIFSWQNGVTYSQVYNLLVEEYNNSASTEQSESGITFKVTPRGFRIADATQEQAILNLYNTTGVAWYFILDTANTRFKLPRMKYLASVKIKQTPITAGTEMTSLGNCLKLGTSRSTSPNWYNIVQKPSASAVQLAQLLSGESVTSVNIDQSNLVADLSNTVNPQTLDNMYLYFYVGEYTQTAVEQTAGLNAELFNNKVDLNFNNMNPSQTAKNTIVEWGIPDYSAGVDYANDTTVHIAPSKGILAISYSRSNAGTGYLKINGTNVASGYTIGGNVNYRTLVTGEYLLSQGDTFQITEEGVNDTAIPLIYRFYPCKGVN